MLGKLKFKSDKSKKLSISMISFIVLIVADIFLSILIFKGLSEQIEQLTTTNEYFPYKYRNIFIEDEWVDNNFVNNIANEVTSYNSYRKENKKHKKMHEVCQKFDLLIEEAKNDTILYEKIKSYKRLVNQFGGYSKYQKSRGYADKAYIDVQTSIQLLQKEKKVNNIIAFIKEKRDFDYSKSIEKHKNLFALKRTLYALLFLVPIIILLLLWNAKSLKKEKELSIVISSHFIVIASLPLIFEITRFIVEILPEVLLKSIYDFLIQSKLVAIWYYILIALSIGVIILLIWFLQNKVFTQRRFYLNRILRSKCTHCGVKVDYKNNYCPNCGQELRKECPSCKAYRISDLDYCSHCGK